MSGISSIIDDIHGRECSFSLSPDGSIAQPGVAGNARSHSRQMAGRSRVMTYDIDPVSCDQSATSLLFPVAPFCLEPRSLQTFTDWLSMDSTQVNNYYVFLTVIYETYMFQGTRWYKFDCCGLSLSRSTGRGKSTNLKRVAGSLLHHQCLLSI